MMTGIPSDCVEIAWPTAAPLLQKVLDKYDTGYTLDELKAKCQARDMQLWMYADRAAFLSEVKVFPRYKTLHVPYIGGDDMAEWFEEVFAVLEAFARHLGCRYISGCGRRGWARRGRARGFVEEFQMVRKRL